MRTLFQGTRHSNVSLTIYPNNGDGTFGDAIVCDGQTAQSGRPAITSLHVQNALAQGASFSASIKQAAFQNPFSALPVDSWVDIVFGEGDKSWHVLRGLLDEVRLSEGASGSGATVRTFTLVGRSFQKIYDDTPAMFNPYLGDKEVSAELLQALQNFVGSPDRICRVLLFDVLRKIGRRGRGYWAMPPHMPGTSGLFVDTAAFSQASFDQYKMPRALVSPSLFQGGPMWGLAQQYSDPAFCELFTELMPAGPKKYSIGLCDTTGSVGLSPANSRMVVYLRDRPFMAVDPKIGVGPLNRASPYFGLPEFVLSKQLVTSLDLGRSSYERRNAFYLGPPPESGVADHFPTYKQPLWYPGDQNAHGLRQMDIALAYNFIGTGQGERGIDSTMQAAKRLVRDFYCLNADFFSGSVAFAQGCPWVKVGSRLQLVDDTGAAEPFHAYIESVSHDYGVQSGTRTQLSFTRGFFGAENQQLKKLQQASSRFVEPYITLAQGATQ